MTKTEGDFIGPVRPGAKISTIKGPLFFPINEPRKPRGNEERKSVILTPEEFGSCLDIAQEVWEKLGVEPLSVIKDSDALLAMNLSGGGERVRKQIEGYKLITTASSITPTFCLLADHLNPRLEALGKVWEMKYGATQDVIERASEVIRARNSKGLGHQVNGFLDIIPTFIRNAIDATGKSGAGRLQTEVTVA